MEIIRIITLALTGVLLAALCRSINKDISIYIVIATVVLIFLAIIDSIFSVFTFLEGIYDRVTYGKTFLLIILKVLAVAYITDFTAQLCRDSGESAIGSKVEFAGKVVIFCLSMPILTAILELIDSLL